MGAVGYLLDTHTLLWSVRESHKLSVTAKNAIADTNVKVFVSAVSAYEIMNKHRIGKLPEYRYIAENYYDIIRTFEADELPVNTKHAHYAGEFEWSHRDPFDRLLAAQSLIEDLILVTNDVAFQTLPWVKILW